ncbi:MAG: hypothetical protein ABJ308_05335 [Halieaceae bacterium]
MIKKVLATVKKETDRQYFFSRLDNPLWITPLREKGYFSSPPQLKQLPDGYVQFPHWPELSYLISVADQATAEVIDVVLALPASDNPRVYDGILSIALKLHGEASARLLPKCLEYSELDNQFLAHRYPELLNHWVMEGNIDHALELAERLVPFSEDPRAQAKRKSRRENPESAGLLLQPSPKIAEWEYQQILEEGVTPIANSAPFQAASMLLDAAASMITLGMHREDLEADREQDYSEIWCTRLDIPNRDYQDSKESLVFALTYACDKVYECELESISALDELLRKGKFRLFSRLRQHLYSLHPSENTKPWIREEILSYSGYANSEYGYEFQTMVREASEHFGSQLLSVREQEDIFERILSGPSKEDYRALMGERYSEQAYQRRRIYFHQLQLRPFVAALQRDYQQYYDELIEDPLAAPISDDNYAPYGTTVGGWVGQQSPRSLDDLQKLSDEALLEYLNEWDEERWSAGDGLIEVNIPALAEVFQSLFSETIVPDENRLGFWMMNRDRIARPIYVAAMINAVRELTKSKEFQNLDVWIELCNWVLIHGDSERNEDSNVPKAESADNPDWGSSRRAVVDFIDACTSKDTDAPLEYRAGIADLLRALCDQFDSRLDNNRPVIVNGDDPISEAINNTRSRALEAIVKFSFWVRRHLPEDPLPELAEILIRRLSGDAEYPLTRPEHAILGMHFGDLCQLSRDCSVRHQSDLFPHDDLPVWQDAFVAYIRYNRPVKAFYELLSREFEFALENLELLVDPQKDNREVVDRLGQHLLSYYLWQVYHLTGNGSLLEQYYERTNDDRERWAQLFDHLGRSLNASTELDEDLLDRVLAYYKWRFEASEPTELKEFTFWLKADCLDPEWRLKSFLDVLGIAPARTVALSIQIKALHKMLPDFPDLVVLCFAKIIDSVGSETQMYISVDETQPILHSGLHAEDPEIREAAEQARENLLRMGRFDFLETK